MFSTSSKIKRLSLNERSATMRPRSMSRNLALLREAVGQVVKAGGRFRSVASPLAKGGAIFLFNHAGMTESIPAATI
jgi:hypothetical protein